MGSKKTTQKTSIPEYLEQGSRMAVDKATAISNRQYTPYKRQRVAGMSEGEVAAKNLALDATKNNTSMRYLEQAGQMASDQPEFSRENLAKYMDPYVEDVVQGALRKEREAYGTARANLGATAAKRGAFGGDRQALLESGLTGKHLQATGDIAAQGYSDAFRTASQLFLSDNDRKMRAADSLRAVGGDIQRLNSQQISDLAATGQIDRLLEQADLDFDYQQFIENRDWDVTNLQPLIATLSSVPHSSTTTQKSSGGALGTILGAGMTAVGMFTGNAPLMSAGAGMMGG